MEVDEFILKCVEDYDSLMEEKYFSASTITQLQTFHQTVKREISGELSQKWESLMSSGTIMPQEMVDKFSEGAEEAFVQLSKHFIKFKHREQSKVKAEARRKEALKEYSEQMEKYMENHPAAAVNVLQEQHSTLSSAAVDMLKSTGGQDISAQIVSVLREEMESIYETHKRNAEINRKSLEDPAIGIDLGTTNCCVMVYYRNRVELVPNRLQGSTATTPSYVAFRANNNEPYGKVAKDEAYRYPEDTIYDAKRMIGRPWDDDKLQEDRRTWPFQVVNDNGNPKIMANGRARFPHEISARLITRLRAMAEEHLGLPTGAIRKAVITVPAYFTEPQRRATGQAAECAGLQVLNILSEPTAAAIAYSWERRDTSATRKALIYDLGGGTFDVAVAVVKPDDVDILGVDGDTHLGGQDFDQLLMDYCLSQLKEKDGLDLERQMKSEQTTERIGAKRALGRLKLQCEIVKERLSVCSEDRVLVDKIYDDKELDVRITKEKLEELVKPLVRTTLDIVSRALENAKGVKGKEDIDDVIIVGGSTRMPLVTRMLSEYFNGKQLCKHINPDQAVAFGAAVQAAILNGVENVKRITVQDVTPLPLGISVVGEKFAQVVPKNAKIPHTYRSLFFTSQDGQTAVSLGIYQGDKEMCEDNKRLGGFILEGLPPNPKGEEKLWVKMKIDVNGMVNVEAESYYERELRSGIRIKAERLGMCEEDVERVRAECQLLGISN